MPKTIQQVHEAAKAFRAQFRPLIEILDEVAELTDLANTRQELETAVETARAEQERLRDLNAASLKELNNAREDTKKAKRQGELQSQQVAKDIADARETAAAEAARISAEVSASIAEMQTAGAAGVAEAKAKVKALEEEAGVLEARLEMLRKAIASIVVGAKE